MFSLRFDFRLAPSSPATMADLYAASLDMAAWAEENGANNVLFSQHHASPDGYLPSPLVMAGAAAARTSSLPIAVGALLLLMYDPIKLAEDIAVLDHLSRGRISYIIGLGYRDEEYAMFGVDKGNRGKLMEERIEVLQKALAGEEFTWDGRRIHVTPKPFSANGPVMAYGGGTPAAARRAARFGLMFAPQTNAQRILDAYDEEATRQGHPTGMYHVLPDGYPTTLFVAKDLDKAWDRLGPYMLHDALMYGEWLGGTKASVSSVASTVDELRAEKGSYRIVTPDEAVEVINRFGSLGLQPLSGGIPPELAWESLELIEKEVIPAVKA